jgi:hypothetical protein
MGAGGWDNIDDDGEAVRQKHWSNTGQIQSKHWSNGGWDNIDDDGEAVRQYPHPKYWSNGGGTVDDDEMAVRQKHWSNTGQMLVKWEEGPLTTTKRLFAIGGR